MSMLTTDGQEVFEEVLEIVSYMTFFSPTISMDMWSLRPLLMEALAEWAIDFFPRSYGGKYQEYRDPGEGGGRGRRGGYVNYRGYGNYPAGVGYRNYHNGNNQENNGYGNQGGGGGGRGGNAAYRGGV